MAIDIGRITRIHVYASNEYSCTIGDVTLGVELYVA
jgi:hypothetical protein